MDTINQQAKELVKQEDGVQGLVVGRDVYDPLLFAPRTVRFSAKQYLFLRAYRLGVPLQEAALKAHLTPEQAERFLDKPDTMAWLEDRALKDHIKNEWEEPGKWYEVGQKLLDQEQVSKHKIEVWKAFGERVAPAKRQVDPAVQPRIEINIDPTAVQEAFRRQRAIEAEVVEGQAP